MARVVQERRVDERTEARQGIEGNPTEVSQSASSAGVEVLEQILAELRIMNIYLSDMVEYEVSPEELVEDSI